MHFGFDLFAKEVNRPILLISDYVHQRQTFLSSAFYKTDDPLEKQMDLRLSVDGHLLLTCNLL